MNSDSPFSDPTMTQYFVKLPPLIKESIWQSGAKPQTIDELKSFVQHLTEQK